MSCEAPPMKRLKAESKAEPETDPDFVEAEPANKKLSTKDKNGDTYFEISSKRRCTVRSFKGRTLIDIREVSDFLQHDYSTVSVVSFFNLNR